MSPAKRLLLETDWEALSHAYGSAADAPDRLLDLVSDGPAERRSVMTYLSSAIVHQSSLYTATPAVARFLAAHSDDVRAGGLIDNSTDRPWYRCFRVLGRNEYLLALIEVPGIHRLGSGQIRQRAAAGVHPVAEEVVTLKFAGILLSSSASSHFATGWPGIARSSAALRHQPISASARRR